MDRARQLLDALIAGGKTLASAESCTGGLLGKLLTDCSGSSAAYLGGVISYSNGVKRALLGVSAEDLAQFGAVSEPVARQMAEGVRRVTGADLGVGITGIAGPNSDGTSKPVGLVFIAASNGQTTAVREFHFSGDRAAVREQSCAAAMELAESLLN